MDGLTQQASALNKFPENVGEIIGVAVSPIPGVSGKVMFPGLFYGTRIPAEGVHPTRLEGREPVTGLLPLGAQWILLQAPGGILIYGHVSL